MIKLTLVVFVLSIIAAGCLQEVTNSLPETQSSNDNSATTKQLWLQQLGLRRSGRKPCPRRSNSNPDGPWVPSYSSRIVRPLYEPTILQPQALKNDEYKVSASAENEQLVDHSRHEPSSSSSSSRKDDDDCDDRLDLANLDLSPNPNAEKRALNILDDCLKKKQKNLERGYSRRSMSEPDLNNNDYNNYPREDSEIGDLLDNNNLLADIVDKTEGSRRQGSSEKNRQSTNLQTLADPAQSTGLTGSSRLQNENNLKDLRICYACSTATNPTCWEPDKRTTIKYCRKEHSCVTKTFGVKNQVTLIRDCGNSCADTSVPGIEPKYKSCKICHNDYCNSAMGTAINIYGLATILIISIVKCTY